MEHYSKEKYEIIATKDEDQATVISGFKGTGKKSLIFCCEARTPFYEV